MLTVSLRAGPLILFLLLQRNLNLLPLHALDAHQPQAGAEGTVAARLTADNSLFAEGS
jgi:hypothetical protein